MDSTYWHKQTAEKPLFDNLLWSRPETKTTAGKLLVIGGNSFGFAAPAEAYNEAGKAGIGSTRVVLPDSVRPLVANLLETVEYAPGNPSGGFSQKALAELLAHAQWADGILLAGDFGRNSETAILLEKLLAKYTGQITITKDALDYFTASPQILLSRPNTTLVLSFAQLQKLAVGARFPSAFTFEMDLLRFIDALRTFSQTYPVNIITRHLDALAVAVEGQVSTTKLNKPPQVWRAKAAAHASVWWLQNPSKPFEALTTSLIADKY